MNYYDYDYGYDYYDTPSSGELFAGMAGVGVYFFIMTAFMVFMLVCIWKIFKKVGKKGWEALIPVYNIIVLLEIVGLPVWYIVLFLLPFANIYALFKIYIELAHKFGKTTGFGVATVFFSVICLPMLAFGKATYTCVTNVSQTYQQQPAQTLNQQTYQQQPTAKKYCTNCGTQINANTTVCPICGNNCSY